MKTRYEITEKEFEVIVKAISNVIGNPSGCLSPGDTIESCSGEHCTSMCIDTFTDSLKRQFIITKALEKYI